MSGTTDLSKYCDESSALDVPVRYSYCPFCKSSVSSRGFIVWRTSSGFRFYCHKCHAVKSVKQKGVAPPSALISRVNALRTNAIKKRGDIYLPSDFSAFIPAKALAWLRKYDITPEEVSLYGFGFSYALNRLILPVFQNDTLVFWQGRSFHDDKNIPKYISVRSCTDKAVFFECFTNKEIKSCVLVEDIVSAICVRRAGYNCIALLGSYIGDNIAARLHALGITDVRIWLDPDKRKDAVRYTKKLSGLGFKCSCVLSPIKDPKDYTTAAIQRYLTTSGLQGGQHGKHQESVQEAGTSEAA